MIHLHCIGHLKIHWTNCPKSACFSPLCLQSSNNEAAWRHLSRSCLMSGELNLGQSVSCLSRDSRRAPSVLISARLGVRVGCEVEGSVPGGLYTKADSNVQVEAFPLPWSVIGFRKALGRTHSARQSSAINKRPKGICAVAFSRSHIRLAAEVEAMRMAVGCQRCAPAAAPCSCRAICRCPGGHTACLALGGGRHPVGTRFLFVKAFCHI